MSTTLSENTRYPRSTTPEGVVKVRSTTPEGVVKVRSTTPEGVVNEIIYQPPRPEAPCRKAW